MNILILVGSLSGGGAEREAVVLANFLTQNGHSVNMAVVRTAKVAYAINENVKIYRLPHRKMNTQSSTIRRLYCVITDYFLLRKIIVENKIEKIIVYRPLPVILILSITKQISIFSRVINYPPQITAVVEFFNKQIYRCSKTVAFQTHEQMKFYDCKIRNKGVVIYNTTMHAGLPMPCNGERRKEIVTFCRLTTQKNLPMLIDGFIRFHEKFSDYRLTVYGNGILKNELEEYIRTKKKESVIKIEDFNIDIHNIVIDSMCFVLTSDWEGISNSMLEAMAIGLPVICTDCKGGGAREFIKNYENGILIPINDREALAQALEYIATNPEKAQAMGEKASKIREILAPEKIGRKWVEILD